MGGRESQTQGEEKWSPSTACQVSVRQSQRVVISSSLEHSNQGTSVPWKMAERIKMCYDIGLETFKALWQTLILGTSIFKILKF